MTRAALLISVGLLVLTAACSSVSGSPAADPHIALLLPESKTARYEAHDRPAFMQRIRDRCPECEFTYANANQSSERQLAQAEAAITNGIDVLVLGPVDSVAAAAIVRSAQSAGIPVVTYDRHVVGALADFHVTVDNQRVGELQAEGLLEAVDEAEPSDDGVLVLLHGSPTDDNAGQFKAGAIRVLRDADVELGPSFDIADWSPDQAQEQMERALASLGRDRVLGVYAANDAMAGAAVAAMKAAGLTGDLPPVTGQDAELSAVQRILAGEQHMTVYKPIREQARIAADVALDFARGGAPSGALTTTLVGGGDEQVPAHILEPTAVTRRTVGETVMADGFWDVNEVCVGRFAAACDAAGIR